MKPEGLLLNLPKIPSAEKERHVWIKSKVLKFTCQQLRGVGVNEEETNGIILELELEKNTQCMLHHRAHTI